MSTDLSPVSTEDLCLELEKRAIAIAAHYYTGLSVDAAAAADADLEKDFNACGIFFHRQPAPPPAMVTTTNPTTGVVTTTPAPAAPRPILNAIQGAFTSAMTTYGPQLFAALVPQLLKLFATIGTPAAAVTPAPAATTTAPAPKTA
jgi:hypothetical protein